jgi:S1-C subfamily serine protease
MSSNKSIAALACGLFTVLSAFADDPAPQADGSARSEPAKFEYARVRSKLLPGDKIGTAKSGWLCMGSHDMKAAARIEEVLNGEAQDAFKKVSRDLDLTLAAREVSAFDTAGPTAADYRVGGVVQAIENNMCTYPGNVKGAVRIEVKWDLFSTKEQRVVYSRTTAGTHASESFESISPHDFEVGALVGSLKDFFADPEIKRLIAGGAPAPQASAQESLHVTAGAFVAGSTSQATEALKSAVVTIMSDGGSGSGFYVADGYVLTNRHVVGASKYVKVKLAGGRELVGEVVREDGPRDVALLKTEAVNLPVVRLRTTEPSTGEEVWAIGSPLGQQLAGTVTRGVLSSVRTVENRRFLQSDVAINPGNSGGPLIDGQANAIGLATLKLNNTSGLAFFVPIADALERLGLVIDAAPAPVAAAPAASAVGAEHPPVKKR